MRIFVAIKISQSLQDTIMAWEKNYRHLPVRWIPAKNLHITLVPPWSEDEAYIHITKERLGQLGGMFGIFSIQFRRVVLGPHVGRPRMIWVQGNLNPTLQKVKDALYGVFEKSEERPFRPHITLARFKQHNFGRLYDKVDWVEHVHSLVLFHSKCLPGGAVYTVLNQVRL